MAQFTIFTGPNNTGKSIIATLLYGLFGENHDIVTYLSSQVMQENSDTSSSVLEDLEADALAAIQSPERDATPELRAYLELMIVNALDIFADIVAGQVERAFGVPLADLRRRQKNATTGQIEIESAHPLWGLGLRIQASKTEKKFLQPSFEELWNSADFEGWPELRLQRRGPLRYLILRLLSVAFIDYPHSARYLPAARSGMMQAQKVITRALYRQAARAGLEETRVPSMSGVVSDFLGSMIDLQPTRRSEQYDAWALKLEELLLKGTIETEESDAGQLEIYFKNNLGRFPLNQTSSMVSEMAPVILMLRHLLRPTDLLIMEEPEAHLHPAGQVEIARALLELTHNRLKVVVTTHSEFLLQRINNSIAASRASLEKADSAGVARESIIDPRLVRAYYFKPTRSGVVVEQQSVNDSDGIQEHSFSTVSEELYDQTVKLDEVHLDDE